MIEPQTIDEARAAFAVVMRRPGAAGSELRLVGGGSKCSDIPIAADAVSTRKLSRVIDYSPEDMTITVEAGVSIDSIDALVLKNNLRLPLDPPAYSGRATVGGVLATNDSGPLRFAYGSPRDNVLGMSIILGDSTLIRAGGRVVKNVAGYALHRLLCGSWGTLGLIANATFKLRPRPESLRLAAFAARNANDAESFTADLLSGPSRPTFVEWLQPGSQVGMDGLAIVVGYEDCTEAVDWQLRELARFRNQVRALDDETSKRIYRELREWGASADIRAAMPSTSLHRIFTAAAESNAQLLAHAPSGTLLARSRDAAALAPLITEFAGHIIAPRHLAADDHAVLRAGLRSAMRTEQPA